VRDLERECRPNSIVVAPERFHRVLDAGAFTSGLLTGLREGVEAALIVSIILAYLAKTGNLRHAPKIGIGVGAAAVLSLLLGLGIFATMGGLQEPYEQLFEGITLAVAAGVVTWMLFWMRRQSAGVGGQLRAAVDRALSDGSAWGLAVLAFTAVIREGVETALFLVGQATAASQADGGAASVLIGALVGLLVAVVLGYGFYRGSRRLNLQSFFRWTGIALIFIAAGLLSQAVHEFVEIGLIPVGGQTAYDISAVLPHEEGIGQFLRAVIGYSSTPEVATLTVYLAYLATVLTLYLRPIAAPPVDRREPIERTELAQP
jgi:high-affinity iron transporter